jgi:glycosyltransferase involved in cell wall biosynthesis
MKIALDVSIQDTPWLTGVERTQRSMVRELAEVDHDNEYLLLSRRPIHLPFELPPNFRHVDLSPHKPGYLWRERLLPTLLAKENVDVYHSPVSAIPVSGSFGKIATVHEVPWLERHRAVEPARRVWLFLNVRYARRIVAVSERTRANILRLYPDAKEKVVVVRHGVDARFTPPPAGSSRGDALTPLGVPDRPYLLFVGAPRRKKCLDVLLAALARVPADVRAGTQLVMAGVRNPKESGLESKVKEFGLGETVRFPGYVGDDDLVRLYQHAIALIFPSRFEGFGLPPLEAMACGTPVVASTGGAIPEVVGDAALLVQPRDVQQLADAIVRILTNETLRANLRRRGLERVKAFSWRRAAQQILDLYAVVGAKTVAAGA